MEFHASVRDLVDRVQEVCPLPETAQRVVQSASSPDSELAEVALLVASDAALAAEVMRIASSPAYRGVEPIRTLERAIARLGLSTLRDMAAAMAMMAQFATRQEMSSGVHERSLYIAAIARGVATLDASAGVDKGQAFLAGLLSEIGMLACLAVDAGAYTPILKENPFDLDRLHEVERARYGTTSDVLGASLLRRNHVDEVIVHAVAGVEGGPLGQIIAFARRACHAALGFGAAVARGREPVPLAESVHRLAHAYGIDVDDAELVALVYSAGNMALEAITASSGPVAARA